MLKITIHSSDEAVTFQVEGKLVGAWAMESEQAWNNESSARNRKAFIVDLTETLYSTTKASAYSRRCSVTVRFSKHPEP